MKYKLLIIWGDIEPELHSIIHNTYEDLTDLAKEFREDKGDEHGLYYIGWEDNERDAVSIGAFGRRELEGEEEE